MYLVAGLAAAGLVGIAAAFYFSIRSGRGGGRRPRRAGAGRAAPGRYPGRRGAARPGRPGDDRRAPYDDRPPRAGRVAGTPAPGTRAPGMRAPGTRVASAPSRGHQAGVRKAEPGVSRRADDGFDPDDPWPGNAVPAASRSRGTRPDESQDADQGAGAARTAGSRPGSRSAARLAGKTAQAAGDEDGTRPRRRMGFRKGADVDEEMWPAEAFGGVSDEQFWDDLASDKPLTTTARTAQQDSGAGKRLADTGQATDPQMLRVTRARSDDRGRGEGRRAAATGGYPEARPGPDPATERTMIQPAFTATQPVPSMTSQASGMTSQTPAMAPQAPAAAPQSPNATQPAATQRTGSKQAGIRPTAQPAETRVRRRPSSAEEDPLTSAAFALRTSGPVDGRSALRAAGSRSAASGPGYEGAFPASTASHTAPYPSQRVSYDDLSAATQAMSTPPYGENYSRGPVPPGDDQRGPNGTRSHARHAGDGTRPVRQAYPQDGYPAGHRQGAGGPPATGSYPTAGYPAGGYHGNGQHGNGQHGNGQHGNGQHGNGQHGNGYPGSGQHGNGYLPGGHPGGGGYPGPGQRAPYDPRDDYRRLTHRR